MFTFLIAFHRLYGIHYSILDMIPVKVFGQSIPAMEGEGPVDNGTSNSDSGVETEVLSSVYEVLHGISMALEAF